MTKARKMQPLAERLKRIIGKGDLVARSASRNYIASRGCIEFPLVVMRIGARCFPTRFSWLHPRDGCVEFQEIRRVGVRAAIRLRSG